MNKTKIEWADYTWNPIKGLCPVDCKTPDGKSYCYARKMYKRFGMNPEIRLDLDELMGPCPKAPSRIFACSTFELFHHSADPYRNNVFHQIECMLQHTFIILTKMPERIDRPMPDNVWLGVSVTGSSPRDVVQIESLMKIEARIRFISFEPILAFPVFPWLLSPPFKPDWIIAGRLTGHGKIHDPERDTIECIVKYGKYEGIPVFLKNNLREIWGPNLIQEFPKVP